MLLDSWLNTPRPFFRAPFFALDPWALERGNAPAQVVDLGDSLQLTLEIPGVSETDVQLTLTGPTLTVAFQRKLQVPDGYVAHQQERRGGAVTRSFRLPGGINAEGATANVKDGLLTVTIPRRAEATPRSIPIQVGSATPAS